MAPRSLWGREVAPAADRSMGVCLLAAACRQLLISLRRGMWPNKDVLFHTGQLSTLAGPPLGTSQPGLPWVTDGVFLPQRREVRQRENKVLE